MTDAPFLLQILMALGSGLGAYAAIRADLARIHERATQALDRANEAHHRLNDIQERRHHG